MFKKLKLKFVIMNMVTISILFLGSFGFIYGVTYNNIKRENREKMNDVISGLINSKFVPDMNKGSNIITSMEEVPADYSLSFSLVLNEDNALITVQTYISLPDEVFQKSYDLAVSSNQRQGKVKIGSQTWLFEFTDLGTIGLVDDYYPNTIVYFDNAKKISFLDITASEQVLNQLLISLVGIGGVMLVVIYAISRAFSKYAVAPVELAYNKQRQFIADASHELKTPLAAIMANTEAIMSSPQEKVEDQKKWFEHIKSELKRMSLLVTSLLYLAKNDEAANETVLEDFNMGNTIRNILVSQEAVIFEKALSLHSNIMDVDIKSNEEIVEKIILILLENAIKYNYPNGEINIDLKETKDSVVFRIENTGPGIPAEDIPFIFDRFYRVNEARTGDGSFGIGLAIADELVKEVKAKLDVESSEKGLTIFTLSLKK